MPAKLLFAIDPSIKALGFAAFDVTAKPKLKHSRVIKSPGDCLGNWVDRLDWMVAQVFELMDELTAKGDSTEIAIELPDYRTEAAANTGSIEKLVACVFSIRSLAMMGNAKVKLIPVRMWKGNLPKDITQRRVTKKWGWKGTDHNEADAVGIGSFVIQNPGKALK